jgi:hypothetical protein
VILWGGHLPIVTASAVGGILASINSLVKLRGRYSVNQDQLVTGRWQLPTGGTVGLDIRLPIGLMFSILGVLLTGYGLFADEAIYQRSLNININLWWGMFILAFGLWMLWLGRPRKGE